MPKLLSIATSARNDNYMGNFIYRLTTSINYLAFNLKKIGRLDDVEILVTDWGSDIPLSKVLPLSSDAAKICRFIYVPPVLAKEIKSDGVDTSTAANIAIRRGKGDFLILFPGDILVPGYSMMMLLGLLDGSICVPIKLNEMYYFIGRYQIPYEIVQRELSVEEWDQYLLMNTSDLVHDRGISGVGVDGAAMMLHRNIWHACRGFNEGMKKWGWNDSELMLRITQSYPWMDLFNIGVSFFHMEHRRTRSLPSRELCNPDFVNPMFTVNDENWGLGDCDLDVQFAENICESENTGVNGVLVSIDNIISQQNGEVLNELTSDEVKRHVDITFQKIGVKRLNENDSNHWDYVDALAWYGLHRHPLHYVEFGIQVPYAACVVASASPGIQIYGIDNWQADNSYGLSIPATYTGNMLKLCDYKGYSRFISGDIRTAFKRLSDSSVGTLIIDLVLFRSDMYGDDSFMHVCSLIPYMRKGGAVVIHSSPSRFDPLWNDINSKYAGLQFYDSRGSEYCSGLILL